MDYNFDQEKYKNVRIYDPDQKDNKYEEPTPLVYIDNRNIEESLNVIHDFGYKYVHIQTFTIDFLSDPRLNKLRGISIQHWIEDLSPFYNFNLHQLTHLSLPEGIEKEFDFLLCPNLVFLGGRVPDNYKNLSMLQKLKHVRIFGYRKKDLREFKNLKRLEKIEIYSMNCTNLYGLNYLKKLEELVLMKCPRLENLDGIGEGNEQLEVVKLSNCKRLKDLSNLSAVKNLKTLHLYGIHEINSFNFLQDIGSLENLSVNPITVGVSNADYYPLIEKLKDLNQLSSLENWNKLDEYLEKEVIVEPMNAEEISELRTILAKSPILGWVRHVEEEGYWEIYSAENCDKAQQILIDLVEKLESEESFTEIQKVEFFKECIIKLNKHNEDSERGFIETVEREELCEFFDNLADAAGIDVLDYDDGIADQWREW